jgi:rRNA-processing protein FCF1
LKQNLQQIEGNMMELLEASTIKEFRNDPYSTVFFVAPHYYWGDTDERQKLLQIQLVKDYSSWIEHFRLLFSEASQEIYRQIDEVHKFISNWIDKESSWDVPKTIQEAQSVFREKIQPFYELIQLLETSKQHELILIPDTNALVAAPDVSQYSISVGQPKYTIIIVPTVLAELDKLKIMHRDQDFRDKVNSVIRRIKGWRNQGSLLSGVTVNKTITAKMVAAEPNFSKTLHWLDSSNDDDRIIASVLELQRQHPSNAIVLVTSDINLQNKAEMANLPFIEPPTS